MTWRSCFAGSSPESPRFEANATGIEPLQFGRRTRDRIADVIENVVRAIVRAHDDETGNVREEEAVQGEGGRQACDEVVDEEADEGSAIAGKGRSDALRARRSAQQLERRRWVATALGQALRQQALRDRVLGRLWALFGPPTGDDGKGFIYDLEDTLTGTKLSAYSGSSGPAFGNVTGERDASIKALEALINATKPVECKTTVDYGASQIGIKKGKHFYDYTGPDDDSLAD